MKLSSRIKRKYRFLKTKYLPFKDYTITCEFGFKINLDITKDVDRSFYFGDFEHENLSFFKYCLNKNDIILDVGANIGIYSLVASSMIGNKGKVYAFEPSNEAYEKLQRNVKLNNFTNIAIFKLGVSDFNGISKFHICSDDAYNSIGNNPMKDVKEIVEIKVVSLDAFCEEQHISKIDVIKIDTEGADFLVLKGAKTILSSDSAPILFCEYNRFIKSGYNFTLVQFEELIRGYGYEIYEIQNGKLILFNSRTSNTDEIICLKEKHKSLFPGFYKN